MKNDAYRRSLNFELSLLWITGLNSLIRWLSVWMNLLVLCTSLTSSSDKSAAPDAFNLSKSNEPNVLIRSCLYGDARCAAVMIFASWFESSLLCFALFNHVDQVLVGRHFVKLETSVVVVDQLSLHFSPRFSIKNLGFWRNLLGSQDYGVLFSSFEW